MTQVARQLNRCGLMRRAGKHATLDAEISNIHARRDWGLTEDNQTGLELSRDYFLGAIHLFTLRAAWNDWIEWG